MSTDRWMNKEIVVYIHNGPLLSHKKEHIWFSSNVVDELRAWFSSNVVDELRALYTEWSKKKKTQKTFKNCIYAGLLLLLLLLSHFSRVRLCDPIDGSPSGSPIPGILQARTLEWVAISFSNACKWKVKVKSLSHVRLWATPWIAA